MRLVQISLFLRFAKERRAYSLSQRVLEALGGKVTKPEPIPERGLELQVEKTESVVLWTPSVIRIIMESVSNREQCVETIISALGVIDGVAPIDEIKQRMVITYWILPAPGYDFASLERKYRETICAQNAISRVAYDSSAIYDIKTNGMTLHHQSGAMAPEQLLGRYLKSKPENLPKSFIFLEATIVDGNMVQYSREETKSFLESSLERCALHSEEFHRIWEGLI